MSPRVSVVIPCYNLGAYVGEAVDSVLAQTFQDFEILVVDDGSTDPDTIRVLDAFERPKTTLFRTPNRGLAAARNFLVERARGEFLCALDADDRLHPHYLERTLAVLERDASVGFVSTRMQMFGAETREWPDDTRCDLETLLCHDPVHCAALVRRATVVAAGGYDERMRHQGNEDWDLWIGIAESGLKGVILDEVLFFYRQREGSMSRACTRGDAHLESVEHIVRKHEVSYRAHLPAVSRWKDASLADLDARNARLEADIAAAAANVERRREELALLKRRLEDTTVPDARLAEIETELREQQARFAAVEAAYHAAAADAAALRASASWRVTAPLRALYGALLGGRARDSR